MERYNAILPVRLRVYTTSFHFTYLLTAHEIYLPPYSIFGLLHFTFLLSTNYHYTIKTLSVCCLVCLLGIYSPIEFRS